jgi:hypothetical protein
MMKEGEATADLPLSTSHTHRYITRSDSMAHNNTALPPVSAKIKKETTVSIQISNSSIHHKTGSSSLIDIKKIEGFES